MARTKAGSWILILLTYFFILTTIFYIVSRVSIDYDLENHLLNSTGGTTDLLIGEGLCANPRLTQYDYYYDDDYNPKCNVMMKTGHIYDESTCIKYVGCEWVEDTSLLGSFFHTITFGFFRGDSTYTCDGEIDGTYYNLGVPYEGDESRTFFGYYNRSHPVYGLAKLSQDQDVCEDFGFTWYDENQVYEMLQPTGFGQIVNIIYEMFTFRINYGFDNTFINSAINFFLVILPFIILVLSAYIMIR